jgi:hypothetical protein
MPLRYATFWPVITIALSSCGASNTGPPADCIHKKGGGCYTIDEPEFRETWLRRYPPSGSVKPPPDCSVCSPLSRPTASTPASPDIPPYLMSEPCLTEHLRLRGAP